VPAFLNVTKSAKALSISTPGTQCHTTVELLSFPAVLNIFYCLLRTWMVNLISATKKASFACDNYGTIQISWFKGWLIIHVHYSCTRHHHTLMSCTINPIQIISPRSISVTLQTQFFCKSVSHWCPLETFTNLTLISNLQLTVYRLQMRQLSSTVHSDNDIVATAASVGASGLVVQYRTCNFHVKGANLAQVICKQPWASC